MRCAAVSFSACGVQAQIREQSRAEGGRQQCGVLGYLGIPLRDHDTCMACGRNWTGALARTCARGVCMVSCEGSAMSSTQRVHVSFPTQPTTAVNMNTAHHAANIAD
eukprot:13927197-Alexandrium_andersonii.AAC.1